MQGSYTGNDKERFRNHLLLHQPVVLGCQVQTSLRTVVCSCTHLPGSDPKQHLIELTTIITDSECGVQVHRIQNKKL